MKETLEEYLKRGGTITKCPPQPTPDVEQKVMPTTPTGGVMSLADGGLFYSEIKEKAPAKKKPPPTINVAALPPSLMKFVAKLKNSATCSSN